MLELSKHRLHTKPIVVLNTAGFYDGLAQQLRRMDDEQFLPIPMTELVFFAEAPADALSHLEHVAPQ
jgi:predicted Rossmann-fold nucleotide-binding protein